MNEQMEFQNNIDEFIKQYSFIDKEQIYTNDSELIPVFRIKQWIEYKNKGIDELIKKYEEEMNIYTSEINHWTDERKNSKDSNYNEYCMCIAERNKEAKILTRIFIKDLEKLKGE
jgi:hypothetical protein